MHASVGIYTEFERLRNDAAREWDMFEQGDAMLEAPQKQQPSGSEAARSTSLPERSHTSALQAKFGGDDDDDEDITIPKKAPKPKR